MAGHFYYDDTEITDKIELSRVLTGGFAQSFNGGAIGSSGIAINDIAGSLNIVGFHRWKYTEDTATPTRVAGGYIGARKISKADVFEAPGVARVWDCDLMDLNVLAGLLVCRGATAKRPAESDVTRISDYLLSDTGSGFYDSLNSAWLVFDNGGVHTAHPLGHDDDDLRGKYPEEVLQSITWDRRVTCLYWDDAAASGEEPSLWWAPPEDVRGAITQKLSNNPAHINGTTVFAAFEGQAVARDPTGITSGAYLTTKAGTIYRTNSTTSAAFISRDRVYSTDLIGKAATAELLAVEMLAFGSAELDVVTCSVEVAAADVNIFREGYSVQAEFTHLPGYSTYQTLTIYNRIIRRPEGMIARYVLDLTLSASAPRGTGGTGGSPGAFPHNPTPATLSIVQQSAGLSTRTFSPAPADADVLVIVGSKRGAVPDWSTDSYAYTDSGEGNVTGAADYVKGGYKTASGETASIADVGLNEATGWFEISAGATLVDHKKATGSGTTAATAAVTIPAGGIAFMVAGTGNGGGFDADAGFNASWSASGWTEDWDSKVADGHPASLIAHRLNSTSADVTITPSAVFSDRGTGPWPWQMIVMVFGPGETASAPAPGQWIYGETIALSGAVGTTAYGYADGSLRVRVDGVHISPASYTETDPAAGTFTLAWEPDADETVSVDYQGR